MKIRRSPIPENSAAAHYPGTNYRDCFRTRLEGSKPISPDELTAAFWTTTPRWLTLLFRIRTLLVKPFGLKAGTDIGKESLREAIRTGTSCGMMTVEGKRPGETVVSLDDKHLKAYFSVYVAGREVYISTLVQYHNRLGVVYFTLIRPFHKTVVKAIFRQIVRELGY